MPPLNPKLGYAITVFYGQQSIAIDSYFSVSLNQNPSLQVYSQVLEKFPTLF